MSDWNRNAQKPWQLSISMGMVEFAADGHARIAELLRQADSRLYQRKQEKKRQRLQGGDGGR